MRKYGGQGDHGSVVKKMTEDFHSLTTVGGRTIYGEKNQDGRGGGGGGARAGGGGGGLV